MVVHFLPHIDDPCKHEVIRFAIAGKFFTNSSQSSSFLTRDDENILLCQNASDGEDRIKAGENGAEDDHFSEHRTDWQFSQKSAKESQLFRSILQLINNLLEELRNVMTVKNR
jgi:hypothetical protein